jgi:uncharacterized protein (UPF0335 family)
MTAKHDTHETELLERILERVESIDKNVEDILSQVEDRFGDFMYRGYNGLHHDDGYH